MNNVWEEITVFRIIFIIAIIVSLVILAVIGLKGYILLVFALLFFSVFIISHTFIQRSKNKQIEEYYEEKIREGKLEKDTIKYFKIFLDFQDMIGVLVLMGSFYVLYLYLVSLDFKINIFNIIGLIFVYTNTIIYIGQITIRKKLVGDRKKNFGFILSCILGVVIGIFLILMK